jgi:mono/diheme cytochrome c family protein
VIRFLYGIVFTLCFLLAAAVAGVYAGALPSGADVKPPAIEEWAAKRSLHASIAHGDGGYANPLQPTDANLIAGVRLYGANCAACHGAADALPSTFAKGFYIEAPQLAKDGVEDDPENVTYWKLDHGIRFTAMPAFGKNLTDEQLWQLTMFVARMDKLSPAVDAEWKKIPSAAASPAP